MTLGREASTLASGPLADDVVDPKNRGSTRIDECGVVAGK
jgi:hypothetical protein